MESVTPYQGIGLAAKPGHPLANVINFGPYHCDPPCEVRVILTKILHRDGHQLKA